ncbi:MAG: TraR/DksA C4-type zinc finger protein [Pseudomonadota bacterium]
MKMPPDPLDKDLVAALGNSPRRKRDEDSHIARAEIHCAIPHTDNGCSGAETLAMIERALLRLSSGTYGICVSCGADIDLQRLEQNPAVDTCQSCVEAVIFKAC